MAGVIGLALALPGVSAAQAAPLPDVAVAACPAGAAPALRVSAAAAGVHGSGPSPSAYRRTG